MQKRNYIVPNESVNPSFFQSVADTNPRQIEWDDYI